MTSAFVLEVPLTHHSHSLETVEGRMPTSTALWPSWLACACARSWQALPHLGFRPTRRECSWPAWFLDPDASSPALLLSLWILLIQIVEEALVKPTGSPGNSTCQLDTYTHGSPTRFHIRSDCDHCVPKHVRTRRFHTKHEPEMAHNTTCEAVILTPWVTLPTHMGSRRLIAGSQLGMSGPLHLP